MKTSNNDRPVVLEVRDIVVQYGRIRALHGISLKVHDGELHRAVISRNLVVRAQLFEHTANGLQVTFAVIVRLEEVVQDFLET